MTQAVLTNESMTQADLFCLNLKLFLLDSASYLASSVTALLVLWQHDR